MVTYKLTLIHSLPVLSSFTIKRWVILTSLYWISKVGSIFCVLVAFSTYLIQFRVKLSRYSNREPLYQNVKSTGEYPYLWCVLEMNTLVSTLLWCIDVQYVSCMPDLVWNNPSFKTHSVNRECTTIHVLIAFIFNSISIIVLLNSKFSIFIYLFLFLLYIYIICFKI